MSLHLYQRAINPQLLNSLQPYKLSKCSVGFKSNPYGPIRTFTKTSTYKLNGSSILQVKSAVPTTKIVLQKPKQVL